jgi:hypothetical protein
VAAPLLPTADATDRRPGKYTPSFADGLGERLLTFDNTTGTALEILRFTQEWSDAPAFERALGARVEELKALRHASLAEVRGVDRLDAGRHLVLVSRHTPGRRLSDLMPKARGPVFARELIGQITPALAALHEARPGLAHGALSPDRIVVAREGRLVIVDHVIGAALATLHLSPERWRSQLGVAVAQATGPITVDARLDVVQLGFIALSLLLGRRLNPSTYPAEMPALLEEAARPVDGITPSAGLRQWVRRALQVGDDGFASAVEAHAAFLGLPDEDASAAEQPSAGPAPARAPREAPPVVPFPQTDVSALAPEPRAGRRSVIAWGLGIVAVAEAVFIAGVLWAQPARATLDVRRPSSVLLDGVRALGAIAPPADLLAGATTPGGPAVPAAGLPEVAAASPAAPPPTPPAARVGGVTVNAPIELLIFENGRQIGSTAGPIALADGPHTFDVVNEALDFRGRETITVRGGQMITLTIGLPNGRISVNAVPWADVLIDGQPAGQTPLANLAIPIGQHEITFRHPQLGEQKQTATVKASGLTRVSAAFRNDPR